MNFLARTRSIFHDGRNRHSEPPSADAKSKSECGQGEWHANWMVVQFPGTLITLTVPSSIEHGSKLHPATAASGNLGNFGSMLKPVRKMRWYFGVGQLSRFFPL